MNSQPINFAKFNKANSSGEDAFLMNKGKVIKTL